MHINKLIPVLVLFTLFFHGCKKSGNDCPGKTAVTIAANHTSITQGWDLSLSVPPNSFYKYSWTGPNGWSMQATGANVTRTNLQLADAGTYSVKAYNDKNCEVAAGSLAITVTPVLNPPCEGSIANNTCTSDIAGLSTFSFNAVYHSYMNNKTSVTCYVSPPAPGNPSMTFTFLGNGRPRPGLYKTFYGFNVAGNEDEVCMNLYDANTAKTYITSMGQQVYVTLVNGKTQICFCNMELRDAPSGNLKYITGKLIIGN